MKTTYKQDTEILKHGEDSNNGLKSLLYFLLMAAIICSMLFLPYNIYASGDIQFGAQITDKKNFSGTLSGRFAKEFEASDLYIVAYSNSENLSLDKLFSLEIVNNEEKRLVWKNQISIFSTYDCIKKGGWGTLSSIDFTPLKNQETGDIGDLIFVLLVVKHGADPLDPVNWYDSAVTTLLTDSGQRIPGQTAFATDQNNDRYYPENITDGDKPLSPAPAEDTNKDTDASEVEKPDIYKISGSRLFYANGSAGRFQVVDISKPETPDIIYSETLLNTPLDLYIINDYVLLIEQISERNDISVALKVFHLQGDLVHKVADEAYTNIQYLASRRSGERIFITGTTPYYYPYYIDDTTVDVENGDIKEGGSQVAAIDISNPASPRLISQKSLEGYDSDIYINSDYLVQIARESWDSTVLHIFDLDRNDPLTQGAQIKIPGRIPSEYHVSIDQNALFVIYRDQDIKNGSSLKIFDIKPGEITNKDAIEEKGSVKGIAPGEELFAGTFMDDRAYIVTYERTDPLWVVDISDHSAPKIMGELEVPGWSEYIRFHKNRLVALGYDDSDGKRRVSVALFSVEDPLKPVLLDRDTPLTGISDYTSSVAIDDDRGFYWNTASGVIMVPINYYTDGNYSGLEIIHVDSTWDSFKRKDFVQADFNVQRGTEAGVSGSEANLENIALSMGDAALNTININPNQKPSIVGEIRLAYNAEQIAVYDGDTQNNKTLFALGGDFYTNGTSDLMRYDKKSENQTGDGEFNLNAPASMTDSELLYPELLMDKEGGLGLIFSWGSSAFRLFDQKTMKLGDIIKLGDLSNWNTSSPIVSKNQLYFALSQYIYTDNNDPKEIDKTYYREPSYSLDTILKRYDCSDMNRPRQLPDISIPGTPKAIFDDTRLITVETSRYYYPYYMYDTKTYRNISKETGNIDREANNAATGVDASDPATPEPVMPVEPIMPPPPDIPDTPQGTRINAVELGQASGVLDKTSFFDQEEYGYSEVVCDKENIYLVAMKDDKTDIHKIDQSTLDIVNTYTVKGVFSPVKAEKGKILLTARGYYPYYRFVPYWNSNEIKLVDVSGQTLNEITTFSSDLYLSENNTVMVDDGIYIANGYRGVVYLPFKK
ncbi:MAG: beta-propeller domain-containing protein [Desulfamplus sp.]|nr:beta-propeller domain-containing protein [Desulfamplus sp.]